MKATISELQGKQGKAAGRDGAATTLRFPNQPGNQERSAQSAIPFVPNPELASARTDPFQSYLVTASNETDFTQSEWSAMVMDIRDLVDEFADVVLFDTYSNSDAPYQQMAMGFKINVADLEGFESRLCMVAGNHRCEDILMVPLGVAAVANPEYITKEKLEAILKVNEDKNYAHRGKALIYHCDTCGESINTLYVDNGVTPIAMRCRTDGCGEKAVAIGRPHEPTVIIWYEWYRPDPNRGRFSEDPDENTHIMKGGLLLRYVGPHPIHQG